MSKKKLIYEARLVEGDVISLSDAEKQRISNFLDSKDLRSIFALANMSKPTVHMVKATPQGCNDRLKEISGWELCEAAILNCLSVLNKKEMKPLEEDFETGLNDE
jgi:hypothetical protein